MTDISHAVRRDAHGEASPQGAASGARAGSPAWRWLLALVIATLLAYGLDTSRGVGGAFTSGFVFDDLHLIVGNERLARPTGALDGFTGDYYASSQRSVRGEVRELGYYRPLAVLSNWIDHQIWGERAAGYHLTNVIMHLLTVIGFFLLVDRLTGQRLLAGGAALLFAVHPVHVESVTFVSGRVDVLAALFSVVSLLLLVRCFTAARSSVPLTLSLVAFFLALLAKEMAVTLPAAVFLLSWTYGPRPRGIRSALARTLPYVGLVVVYAAVRLAAIGSLTSRESADRSIGEIVSQVAVVVTTYLGTLVWPPARFNVEPVPAMPDAIGGRVIAGLLLIALVAAIALVPAARRRLPAVSVGLLWMLAALVPVSHILPVETLIGERYMYIPSLGACLAIAALVVALLSRGREVTGAAARASVLLFGVVGVAYAASTVHRNAFFRDNRTFWEAKAQLTPSAESFTALAIEHTREGNVTAAAEAYTNALEQDPRHLEALNNYALVLLDQGLAEESIQLSARAVGVSPVYAEALNTLANGFHAMGRFPQAVGQYKRALRARPDYRQAWVNLGNTYFAAGVPDSAARAYQEALALAPDRGLTIQTARCIALSDGVPAGMELLVDEGIVEPETAEAYLLQGSLDALTGYTDAAVASVLRATQVEPGSVEAWLELGQLLDASGRRAAAGRAFERALELRPDLSVVHNNLGVFALNSDNVPKALEHFTRAVELAPNDPEVLRNLGGALLRAGNTDMAIDALTRAIAAGRDAMAFFHRGSAYQEKGRLSAALADYRSAIALNPTLFEAYFRLGTLYALSDRPEQAILAYDSFLRFSPPDDVRREQVLETLENLRERVR